MTRLVSHSADDTTAAGRSFARSLKPGDVVALVGTLGSGKTRFVAGVCEGLGVHMLVTSPTFTLINEYAAPFGSVAHADLYRCTSRREVVDLGLEEYFNDRCICLIEWADAILDLLPPGHYLVSLTHGANDDEREIAIDSCRKVPA